MRLFLRSLAFATVLGTVAFGAGCKSQCRQLREKLCECATSSVDKEACLNRAQRDESNAPKDTLNDAANAQCAELLPQCDCHNIDTQAGKEACGLARKTDGGE